MAAFLSLTMLVSSVGTSFAAERTSIQAKAGNSIATATPISVGGTYNGSITNYNERDFYKITLTSSGELNVKLTSYIDRTYFYVYDEDGKSVYDGFVRADSASGQGLIDFTMDLTSGVYYIGVVQCRDDIGNYKIKTSFISANQSFEEVNGGSNNSLIYANKIELNKTYNGQIAYNDNRDFYKFTLNKSEKINLKLTSYIFRVYCNIYDKDGKTVYSKYVGANRGEEYCVLDEDINLEAGEYYISFSKWMNDTGNYNFKITSKSSQTIASTLNIANANYPTTLTQGQSFKLNGTISSNYKLTSVTVRVLDSYGNAVSAASKTVNPNAYSYSNIDSGIKFGSLSAGNYRYQIIAKDASGTQKTLLDKAFTVQAVSNSVTTIKTGKTTSSLNVRKGPSTSYASLGKLSQGATVQIVGTDSATGWYKIKYGTGYGYVSNKYVTITGTSGGNNNTVTPGNPGTTVKTGKTTSSLNVRKGPSTSYASLGKLAQGATVQIVGTDSATGWYKIKYGTGYGYISNKYVTITGTSGGNNNTVTPGNPGTAVKTGKTTSSLNVRKGPSTSYASLGKLAQGATVQIVGTDSATGWYKIKYGTGYGYVSNKYVKLS